MQKLFIKEVGNDGKPILRPVYIIRSWQESDGKQIYLHHNGIYGYKDGSPVKGKEEFEIISDSHQRKLAETWWDRSGKQISEKYYANLEKTLAARQDGLEGFAGSASDLDAAQYVRRLITDRKKNAWSEPMSWFECSPDGRPDWWGKATVIEIGNYRYKSVEAEPGLPGDDEDTQRSADDEDTKEDADLSEKLATGDDSAPAEKKTAENF